MPLTNLGHELELVLSAYGRRYGWWLYDGTELLAFLAYDAVHDMFWDRYHVFPRADGDVVERASRSAALSARSTRWPELVVTNLLVARWSRGDSIVVRGLYSTEPVSAWTMFLCRVLRLDTR